MNIVNGDKLILIFSHIEIVLLYSNEVLIVLFARAACIVFIHHELVMDNTLIVFIIDIHILFHILLLLEQISDNEGATKGQSTISNGCWSTLLADSNAFNLDLHFCIYRSKGCRSQSVFIEKLLFFDIDI